MDDTLAFYRIYRAFKKAALNEPSFKKTLLSLQRPVTSTEKLKTHSSVCVVDNDWVDYIAEKLPFLVNAVAEERQFVRSEGEVLPIDRVMHISKESIEDLGKHSNYLTHKPEDTGGRVIPDKLLVSKKENDYKVYENRFLYTCLVYLTQFVEVRLNEIIAISGQYEGESHYAKKVETPLNSFEVSFSLHERRSNDPISANRGGSAEAIRKISSFLATARSLMSTPLMKDVSTAPMVKSPITKTNVIRFDPNFYNTLDLYHFLHSYDKKGYEIKTIDNEITPLQTRCKEDFALFLFVDSFLTYAYGNQLVEELHLKSEEVDKEEKAAELKKYRAKLAAAKANMLSHAGGQEEYILLIEEGEKMLEKALSEKDDELANLSKANASEAKKLSLAFDEALLKAKKEFSDIVVAKDAEIEQINASVEARVKEAEEKADARIEEANARIREADAKIEEGRRENEKLLQAEREKEKGLEAEIASLREEIAQKEANLIALQKQAGHKDFEEMSSKEKFEYLEQQKKAFEKYYKEQWALTKKVIMKNALAEEAERGKKKKEKKGKKEEPLPEPEAVQEEAPLTPEETPAPEAEKPIEEPAPVEEPKPAEEPQPAEEPKPEPKTPAEGKEDKE